jgi:rhamnogalacturonan endolyase
MKSSRSVVVFLALFIAWAAVAAAQETVRNGGFEVADVAESGWTWWSRDDMGSARIVDGERDGGRCAYLEYDGSKDWAFFCPTRVPVGDCRVWTASAWLRCEDTQEAGLAVVGLRDGKTVDWSLAQARLSGTQDWQRVFAVTALRGTCDTIYVRLVGRGKTRVWVDDVALEQGDHAPKLPPKPKVEGWGSTRVEERMDRGVVAMRRPDGSVYVGWRLLKDDPADVAFNVYRVGGAEPVKLSPEPIRATTDIVDTDAPVGTPVYHVRPVVGGNEGEPSAAAKASADPRPYVGFRLEGDHTFQKAGIADLNADGAYDFVIKQPGSNIDPWHKYWKRSEGPYTLEAYMSDGTFLWRRSLGWAIEQGIWYSPYLVYDFDGDGKAEVAVKTGEGDPRDEDGRVRTGPEYVSILDGMTGEEVTRADWPDREGFTGEWWYNFASRNQLGVAYLDGRTPCLLVARGTYNIMKLDAYQYRDKKLELLWQWTSREESALYHGQGAHFMHCADVDDDGRDEVVLGSCVIDDNGNGLWSTGLRHADHCYLGDIDPARPGLEIYYGIEPGRAQNAVCLVDARTGEIIWGIDERTEHVHASGLCADIIAEYPGRECYSGESQKPARWLHSATGELLADETKWDVGLSPRAVHWDADLQRELLIKGRILDYGSDTPHTEGIEGGNPAWADVLGDWREEIITSVAGELRVYTTTIPANDRRVCLMQDPIHRIDVAHLAMGYGQPPMTTECLSAPLHEPVVREDALVLPDTRPNLVGPVVHGRGEYVPFRPEDYKDESMTVSTKTYRHGEAEIRLMQVRHDSSSGSEPFYCCRAWFTVEMNGTPAHSAYWSDMEPIGASYGLFLPKRQPSPEYFAMVKWGDYDNHVFLTSRKGEVVDLKGGYFFVSQDGRYLFSDHIDVAYGFAVFDLERGVPIFSSTDTSDICQWYRTDKGEYFFTSERSLTTGDWAEDRRTVYRFNLTERRLVTEEADEETFARAKQVAYDFDPSDYPDCSCEE